MPIPSLMDTSPARTDRLGVLPWRRAASLALVMALAMPSMSYANKWLAWLEELSGPGPFHGWVVTADVACLGSPPNDAESLGLMVVAAVKSVNGTDQKATDEFDKLMASVYQRPSAQLTSAELDLLGSSVFRLTPDLIKSLGTLIAPQVNLVPNAAGAPAGDAGTEPLLGFWAEYEKQQRRFRRCRVDRSNNIVSVQLEFGRYHDDTKDKSYTGETQLTTINAVAYLPVERLVNWNWKRSLSHGGRFIEVGTGVGAYGMSGSSLRDRDLWRGVVPFRVRVIPSEFFYGLYTAQKAGLDVSLNPKTEGNRWRRALQAIEYRFGQDLVLGTLDHRLFGQEGPVTTDQTHEWVRSFGFNFDLGIAFRALIGH